MKAPLAGFEEAYALLHGFEFDDQQSRENALWAFYWVQCVDSTLGNESFRPPMVVITGPCGCGKTTLLNRLVSGVKDQLLIDANEKLIGQVLNNVAIQRTAAINFDFPSPKLLKSKTLARFITSREWTFRKLRSTEVLTERLRTMVFVTTHREPKLSDDLARRAIVIRLKSYVEV